MPAYAVLLKCANAALKWLETCYWNCEEEEKKEELDESKADAVEDPSVEKLEQLKRAGLSKWREIYAEMPEDWRAWMCDQCDIHFKRFAFKQELLGKCHHPMTKGSVLWNYLHEALDISPKVSAKLLRLRHHDSCRNDEDIKGEEKDELLLLKVPPRIRIPLYADVEKKERSKRGLEERNEDEMMNELNARALKVRKQMEML